MAVTGLRHGGEGAVVITTAQGFAAFLVQVTKWDLDWPNDYFPNDTFADSSHGHKFYRGQYSPNGTIAGYCDGRAFGTGHNVSATPSTKLYLVERNSTAPTYVAGTYPASSVVYEGSAFINVKIGVDRQSGLNSYTATFKGHGDWIETVTA